MTTDEQWKSISHAYAELVVHLLGTDADTNPTSPIPLWQRLEEEVYASTAFRERIDNILGFYRQWTDEDNQNQWRRDSLLGDIHQDIMNILVKVWGKDEVEERFYLQEEPFEFQHIDVAIHRVLDARVPQLPKEKPGHGGRGYLAASYYLIELLDGVVYDSIGERIDQSDEAQNFVFEVCKVVQPTTTPTTMRNWIRHFQEDILPTRPSEPETAFWLKTQ